MTQSRTSVLKDLEIYRRGTPKYIKANKRLKAMDETRRKRKAKHGS